MSAGTTGPECRVSRSGGDSLEMGQSAECRTILKRYDNSTSGTDWPRSGRVNLAFGQAMTKVQSSTVNLAFGQQTTTVVPSITSIDLQQVIRRSRSSVFRTTLRLQTSHALKRMHWIQLSRRIIIANCSWSMRRRQDGAGGRPGNNRCHQTPCVMPDRRQIRHCSPPSTSQP